MSIIIEGMNMPEHFTEMSYLHFGKTNNGDIFAQWVESPIIRTKWYPVYEISSYGRLIDADRLIDRLNNQIDKVGKETVLAERNRDIISIIDSLSPVILADTESS